MKKANLLFLILFFESVFCCSQTKENRALSDFNSLQISGPIVINIVQSKNKECTIKAVSSAFNSTNIKVENGVLKISPNKYVKSHIQFSLQYFELNDIKLFDNSILKNENSLMEDSIKLFCFGKSKANLNIIAKKIQVSMSESSKMVLLGASDSSSVKLTGSSEFNSMKMSSNTCYIEAKGSSIAKISVNQSISAYADEASSIYYLGNPENIGLNKSGTGKIEKIIEGNSPSAGNSRGDTTTLNFGKRKYIIIEEEDAEKSNDENGKSKFSPRFTNWVGIELAQNYWMNKKMQFNLPDSLQYIRIKNGLKSLTCNINLIQYNFHIYKNYINLVTGLGLSLQSFGFQNKIKLDADSSFTYYFFDSLKIFTKNKLKVNYLSVPIFFEMNTSKKPSKSFHIAAGVLFYFKLNSKTKRNFQNEGYNFKEIRKDEYNLNPFRFDVSVRLGYRRFTVFTTYALNSIFQDGHGPQVYPFMLGLRILPLF